MDGGFSFCGIDIAELDLEYAPDNANTYVYKGSDQKVNEMSFDGHDGGYYFGATAAAKQFSLRCFYQDKHVNSGLITRIENVFKIGKTGKLVFKKRPWVEYTATVVDSDFSKMLNFQNGIVTIVMKAYNPKGKLSEGYVVDTEDESVLNNSALLSSERIPAVSIVGQDPLTEQMSFLLYNGGTENAEVAIEIAGTVGEGVIIANATTAQKCRFVALSDELTTNAGKYLITDSTSGKTVLTDGKTAKPAFLYHDYGFISLKPAYPIKRNVQVTYTQGISTIYSDSDVFSEEDIGKFVYLGGGWRKISNVISSKQASVTWNADGSLTVATDIVTMNELTISPESEMSISRLNFIYRPTFK